MKLRKTESTQTEDGWVDLLESYGHVWFSLDGVLYFVFPEGPHKYGFCRWEGPEGPNVPEREFNSEEEFLNAKLFGGRSILERLDDVLCYDP